MTHLLLSFANDKAGSFLREIAAEHQALLDLFRAHNIEPLTLAKASIKGIVAQFQEHRQEIILLHYGGHADDHALIFESSSEEMASAVHLAAFLGMQQSLKLVFLNGCSTENQAKALLNQGIPAVIATSTSIGDRAAKEFAEAFYKSMLTGNNVSDAFDEAGSIVMMSHQGKIRDVYRESAPRTNAMPWNLFTQGNGGDWKLPKEVKGPDPDPPAKKGNNIDVNGNNNIIVQDVSDSNIQIG